METSVVVQVAKHAAEVATLSRPGSRHMNGTGVLNDACIPILRVHVNQSINIRFRLSAVKVVTKAHKLIIYGKTGEILVILRTPVPKITDVGSHFVGIY